MNIAEILRARAHASGEAAAIIEAGATASFAMLEAQSRSVAAQLGRAGVASGDRVLVFVPISIALYAVLIGLWRIGAVAMVVDPSGGRAHLERCCRRVPPRAFIGIARAHWLRLLSPSLRALPIAFSIGRWVPRAQRLHLDPVDGDADTIAPADAETPALVTFTSGSTGEPKAAVRTHGFLLAQHRVLADDLQLEAGQRDLSTLPIFVLANLASGVTSIIPDADLRQPGAIEPVPVARQILATAPTRLAASPALIARLVAYARSHPGVLASFEQIYAGGAPVFPALLRAVSEVAPTADVVAVYGSTEAEPIARIRWADISAADLEAMADRAGLLVGRPVPAIDLRILPDRWGQPLGPFTAAEFEREALGHGAIGEIVVAGDHVLGGYEGGLGNRETKIRVDHRVWHRTGDAGSLDQTGRLWLLGRCAARIQDSKGTLYPFAVECAVQELGSVRRCACVAHQGRRIVVVEPEGPVEAEELVRAVHMRAGWAHLDQVRVVPALPVDARHNAKVDYPRLQRLLK